MIKGRVFIADASPAVRLQLTELLTGLGRQVRSSASPATVLKWLAAETPDLVILEATGDGRLDLAREIRAARPKLPMILTAAGASLDQAVNCVGLGAVELLRKPLRAEPLLAAIDVALSQAAARAPADVAPPAPEEGAGLTGSSPAMQKLRGALARLAEARLPVVIWGETGVGKTRAAQALHALGASRGEPLVRLALGGDPAGDVRRQLLGDGERPGPLLQAQGGTLILECVDELSWREQGQLLEILDQAAPPRLVSTARQDLRRAVRDGRFREDLYFRLSAATLRMPALRERAQDVPELARLLVVRAQREGFPFKQVTDPAMRRLQAHAWPGNIRELDNLVRRLCALHAPELITLPLVEQELAGLDTPAEAFPGPELSAYLDQRISACLARGAAEAGPEGLYDSLLARVEARLLQAAIRATEGNQSQAAEVLGLHRNTLKRKLEELALAAQDGGEAEPADFDLRQVA